MMTIESILILGKPFGEPSSCDVILGWGSFIIYRGGLSLCKGGLILPGQTESRDLL